MKHILLFSLGILFGIKSYSQTAGSWVISDGHSSLDAWDMQRDNSGNTYMVGGLPVAGMGFGLSNAMYCKIDSTGTVIWGGTYTGTTLCGLSHMELTSDGGFIAIGNQHIGSLQDAILVVKVDQNGSIQWIRRIYDPNGGTMWSADELVVLTNGNYVVMSTWIDWGGGGGGGRQISCFDPGGTRIWNKILWGDHPFTAALPTYDGGFFGLSFNFELIRFDSMGTAVWGTIMNLPGPIYVIPTAMHRTVDQKFLVAVSLHNGLYPSVDIGIAQLDSNGTVDWLRGYITAGDEYFPQVVEEEDGYTIAASAYFPSLVKDSGYVIRVNEAGDVRWAKKKNDFAYFHKAVSAEPGKCLIGGTNQAASITPALFICADSIELFYGCYSDLEVRDTAYAPGLQLQATYLLVDSTLVDQEVLSLYFPLTSSVDCNAVGIEEATKSLQITVTPNPSTGLITIQNLQEIDNGHISIYNLIGDLVYDETFEGHQKSFQTGLIPGVYLLVVNDQKNQFQSKLIIQ